MNKYEDKINRMEAHLLDHQSDYQTVISLFKVRSDSIQSQKQHQKNMMMKEISKYKKAGVNRGKQA